MVFLVFIKVFVLPPFAELSSYPCTPSVANDEHLGGDTGMMTDLTNYVLGDTSSISITGINDSVNGHLCVYAAEKARKSDTVIDLKREFG